LEDAPAPAVPAISSGAQSGSRLPRPWWWSCAGEAEASLHTARRATSTGSSGFYIGSTAALGACVLLAGLVALPEYLPAVARVGARWGPRRLLGWALLLFVAAWWSWRSRGSGRPRTGSGRVRSTA